MKLRTGEMQLAIHQTLDCEATRCVEIVEVTPENNSLNDKIEVYVFEIEGHPIATRCFAWGVQKSERTLLIPTVLQTADIRNAEQAVDSYRLVEIARK